MIKPVLALDVDGPLALMGSHAPEQIYEAYVDQIPVSFCRGVPGRLALLAERFRIVWSTSWGKRASLAIAPLVGLPEGLPYIPFGAKPREKRGRSYKLPGLKACLRDAPAAIVDDEIGEDMRRWAAARPHTLLVEIDPRVGLQDLHVRELLRFADQVHSNS